VKDALYAIGRFNHGLTPSFDESYTTLVTISMVILV
jgi:hypothetical protein